MDKETNCARLIEVLGEVGRCWLEVHEFLAPDNYYEMVMPTVKQLKLLIISKKKL